MSEDSGTVSGAVLLIGLPAIGAALVKVALEWLLQMPPMAGYLMLGAAPGAMADRTHVLSEFGRHAIELLAAMGVVVLLFRIGLESDPLKRVRQLPNADLVPSLFTPFFFVGIGLGLPLEVLTGAAVTAGVLLPVAIIGKLGGTGLVVAVTSRWTAGLLIGASMVPRAKIAMIIMQHGRRLGEAVVPDTLYAGMALTSLASSVLASPAVPTLLRCYPPAGARGG